MVDNNFFVYIFPSNKKWREKCGTFFSFLFRSKSFFVRNISLEKWAVESALKRKFFTQRITKYPAGKIAEKAMWRSVFLCIGHCIFNADSTKTPSSSLYFLVILPTGKQCFDPKNSTIILQFVHTRRPYLE